MDTPGMTTRKIGTCSLCGGNVLAYTGPWASVSPPPEPCCASCNAVVADEPVINMRPRNAGRFAELARVVQKAYQDALASRDAPDAPRLAPDAPGWWWRRESGADVPVQVLDDGLGVLRYEFLLDRYDVAPHDPAWRGPVLPPYTASTREAQ